MSLSGTDEIPPSYLLPLKNIIFNLLSNSKDCWDKRYTILNGDVNSKAIKTKDWLQKFKPQINYNTFRDKMAKIKDKVDLGADNSIYLPPLDDDQLFVPLLTFEIDSTTPKACFRVEFFRHDEVKDSVDYAGFRFETPTHGSSKHQYYHVQPIEEMTGLIADFPNKGPKLLGTTPCIPIHADNPICLLLSLILSLYGLEGYNKITMSLEIDESLSKYIETCVGHGEEWAELGFNHTKE